MKIGSVPDLQELNLQELRFDMDIAALAALLFASKLSIQAVFFLTDLVTSLGPSPRSSTQC